MSEGEHHEIDAAKKLCLATAKATASSASTMMDSATSTTNTQARNSNENDGIARSDSNNNNTIRKCGPPPPPPPGDDDAIAGSTSPQKRAATIASKRERIIQSPLTLFQHVATCNSAKCLSANCTGLLKHGAQCTVTATDGCNVCNRMRAWLQIHVRQCKAQPCPIPNCLAIREQERNKNNNMRKYGPPPPPPGDDAITGSTSPQKRAATIVSEHQRSIQLHLTLLQHVVTCNSTTCPSAYCTKMKDLLKHGAQCTVTATGGCNVCKRIRALLKAQQCPIPNCMAIREGVRQWKEQQQAMAAEGDIIPIPITIEIFSYLDQESLMNLSLVSKQSHDIICYEPGNENKIIPVFEVSGSSIRKLLQFLRDNFFNERIKNKLQSYPHMKLKLHYFDRMFDHDHEVEQMTRDVRMDWITSLEISLNSISPPRHGYGRSPLYIVSKILPKLRELDLSKSGRILTELSKNFPLLEKVTANNLTCFTSSGFDMRFCDNLKEIYMDHSSFEYIGSEHEDDISDLNNHPEIFMFYCCCKALERVSVRNMIGYDDRDDDEFLTQNILIKFVRNAPPSLHWFRSDLTPDNIRMLRMERPGIELLN